MVTRTPWACSSLLLLLLLGCSQEKPVPTLALALKTPGGPREKAKAFLEVAFYGPPQSRQEAFFLAGLFACDAASPSAALRAFSQAQPTGSLAFLANRRLEEACARKPLPPSLLGLLKEQSWVSPAVGERIALLSAEAFYQSGEVDLARSLLWPAEQYSLANRPRARVLRAKLWREEALFQKQALLLEAPQALAEAFPEASLAELTRGFKPQQWRQLAAAWLALGAWQKAYEAAKRAGDEGAPVAAQALLALRQSGQALAWAARLAPANPQRFLLTAQALRQQAWAAEGSSRAVLFAQQARAARQALALARGQEQAEAAVLLAEALTELGELGKVPPLLQQAVASKPARWEWVARRALLQAARRGQDLAIPLAGVSSRLARLAQFWLAYQAWKGGQEGPLVQVADWGHPDLVGRWASQLLRRPPAWQLTDLEVSPPPPPSWSRWLLAAGRTSDVVVAWRGELEAAGTRGPAWLGLLKLAQLPPLESIPLLVRAEPKLSSGPWNGLSRQLLRQYLPLPFAQEVVAAASREGIPPWYLAALVRQESAFDPQARSPKGALGLAQLLPQTAGLPPSTLLQPAENLQAGARFLARLWRSFGGAWEPTLAAYNAGERRIRSAWEKAGKKEGPFFVESLELPETWDYVHRVLLFAEGYKALYWPDKP